MNQSPAIYTNATEIINDPDLLYYKKSYLIAQQHDQLLCFDDSKLFLPLVIDGDTAISIPRSPFGSFFVKNIPSEDEFNQFLNFVLEQLKTKEVNRVQLIHPPKIYSRFLSLEWLTKAGFSVKYEDVNQHIELSTSWEKTIHEMQSRKLERLKTQGFEFKKMDNSQLETGYKFIDACRQVQGLNINISFDLLKELHQTTEAYDVFGVFRDGKISALCITARVTTKAVYYYLPATSPMFRTESPMVLLIAGMVDYYRSQGFKYFDLGVSSIEGVEQETLKVFKERMGGIESKKPFLEKTI